MKMTIVVSFLMIAVFLFIGCKPTHAPLLPPSPWPDNEYDTDHERKNTLPEIRDIYSYKNGSAASPLRKPKRMAARRLSDWEVESGLGLKALHICEILMRHHQDLDHRLLKNCVASVDLYCLRNVGDKENPIGRTDLDWCLRKTRKKYGHPNALSVCMKLKESHPSINEDACMKSIQEECDGLGLSIYNCQSSIRLVENESSEDMHDASDYIDALMRAGSDILEDVALVSGIVLIAGVISFGIIAASQPEVLIVIFK